MISLAYSISPLLKEYLKSIALLREKILLAPLSPKDELKFRWEATLSRIYWSLKISGSPVERQEIQKILSLNIKKPGPFQLEVINYKKAMDHINQNWLVNHEVITPETCLSLHRIVSPSGYFYLPPKELKQSLEYLQIKPEDPIITAALIQSLIINVAPFSKNNVPTAHLLVYLALYKDGYDFRGLMNLEEYWHRDLTRFQEIIKTSFEKSNLTPWLEYFAKSVIAQLEKAVVLSTSPVSSQSGKSLSFWELNKRQKAILSILEQPGAIINNREIQEQFKVSQITASRDLAKLVALGLVFSHGKGRSTCYTRI